VSDNLSAFLEVHTDEPNWHHLAAQYVEELDDHGELIEWAKKGVAHELSSRMGRMRGFRRNVRRPGSSRRNGEYRATRVREAPEIFQMAITVDYEGGKPVHKFLGECTGKDLDWNIAMRTRQRDCQTAHIDRMTNLRTMLDDDQKVNTLDPEIVEETLNPD
jgi:hypothetical protein